MGCDIHLTAEAFVAGSWQKIPDKVREEGECWYCDDGPAPCFACGGDRRQRDEWYEGRNYTLFAVLADVRNSGITPISAARGVPNDCCKAVAQYMARGGDDYHNHSWLTLEELIAWPGWDQSSSEVGWVGVAQYKRFLKTGRCEFDADYGNAWVDLTADEMTSVVESRVNLRLHRTLVTVKRTLRDYCESFFKQTIDGLKTKAVEMKIEDLSQIRIVFAFDN